MTHARIVYDKFHILRHVNEAGDGRRRAEFFRQGGHARGLLRGTRWLPAFQRLPAFQKVGRLPLRHLDGILAYCHAKVPFGKVEAINGNIRALRRRLLRPA